jgi:hypothetical protein
MLRIRASLSKMQSEVCEIKLVVQWKRKSGRKPWPEKMLTIKSHCEAAVATLLAIFGYEASKLTEVTHIECAINS